jgi:hypothetical protein
MPIVLIMTYKFADASRKPIEMLADINMNQVYVDRQICVVVNVVRFILSARPWWGPSPIY